MATDIFLRAGETGPGDIKLRNTTTPDGGGSITAAIAWTQEADAWALASTVKVIGTIAWTESADTWAVTAAAKVSGSIAWTQSADTWAIASTVKVNGAIDWTQGADTWAVGAAALVSGAVAWTQGGDTWAVAAEASVDGVIAFTQGSDTWALECAVAEVPAPSPVVADVGGGGGGGNWNFVTLPTRKRNDVKDDILAAVEELERATAEAVAVAEVKAPLPQFAPARNHLATAMEAVRQLDAQVVEAAQHEQMSRALAAAEKARMDMEARDETARLIARARRVKAAASFLAVVLDD